MALNKGGVLVPAIVTKDFAYQFDAWMYYPKVPESVKERQSGRRQGQFEI